MEMIITDNDKAREAIKAVVAEAGLSLTKLSELQGISMGSLGRFVNQRTRKGPEGRTIYAANLHLRTFLRALDGAGYEVVVRPKVTGSRRERRLQEMKRRANGEREASPSS